MDNTTTTIEVPATPVNDSNVDEKFIKNVVRRLRNKRYKRIATGAGAAALVITLVVILASKGNSEDSTVVEVVVPETDNI